MNPDNEKMQEIYAEMAERLSLLGFTHRGGGKFEYHCGAWNEVFTFDASAADVHTIQSIAVFQIAMKAYQLGRQHLRRDLCKLIGIPEILTRKVNGE